jgi:Tol biopolymer transport system component
MYYVGYGGFNIWVASPDGSNATFQYVTAVQNEAGTTIVQIPYVPGAIDATFQPAWSPGGTLLVYTAYASGTGYSMFMWDISSWASSQIGPYGMGDCIEPSWSPDGSSIAYSSDMGGFYHIWLLSINGNLTSSLVGY